MIIRDSNGQFMQHGKTLRSHRISIRVTGAELALAHIQAQRSGLTLTKYIMGLVEADAEKGGVNP